MTYDGRDPQIEATLRNIGADMREARESAGLSCEQVAALVGSSARDSISKAERGLSGMSMFRYLVLMWYMRDIVPDHPGVALARKMLPPDVKRGELWSLGNH